MDSLKPGGRSCRPTIGPMSPMLAGAFGRPSLSSLGGVTVDGGIGGDVIVANPGHVGSMAATALGMARSAVACGSTSRRSRLLASKLTVRPPACPRRSASAWRLSSIAAAFRTTSPPSRTRPTASKHEVCAVLAQRLHLQDSLLRRIADWRDAGFDSRVADVLHDDDRAVFVAYAAALRTIEVARAKEIPSLLEYVIAHHDFSERILQEEMQRRPEYASTMQFHHVPPRAGGRASMLRFRRPIASSSDRTS